MEKPTIDEEEIWKDVVGYEGAYMISNLGNAMACEKYRNACGGRHIFHKATILKTPINRTGYKTLMIGSRWRRKRKSIHQLVAIAFIPNPQNKPYVNHKDGVKLNNCVWNLEWVTCKENIIHAFETGLSKRGEKSHKAKLTDKEVLEIRSLYSQGCKISVLTKKFSKVKQSTIREIVYRKTWRHLESDIYKLQLKAA